MADQQEHRIPPPPSDGDVVRIIRRGPHRGAARRWVVLPVLLAFALGAGYRLFTPHEQPLMADHAVDDRHAGPSVATAAVAARPRPAAPAPAARFGLSVDAGLEAPDDNPSLSQDENELSNYISPGAPAPTMAEVIAALHDAGIHDGIGAFNPPGTSPPLQGLIVPEDFELPEGYVRHHQVTDAGEPIKPILMFAPDFKFYDKHGNLVELPPDRVVPPEMAPLGMPLEPVRIPAS